MSAPIIANLAPPSRVQFSKSTTIQKPVGILQDITNHQTNLPDSNIMSTTSHTPTLNIKDVTNSNSSDSKTSMLSLDGPPETAPMLKTPYDPTEDERFYLRHKENEVYPKIDISSTFDLDFLE